MTWSKNLNDYVKVYDGWCDAALCEHAIEELKQADQTFETHTFYNEKTKSVLSNKDELSVSYADISLLPYFRQRVWDGLFKYHNDLIDRGCSWYQGWNRFSPIRFNKYDQNTQMALHCDHIHSMFDGVAKGIPVLSIVGVLNEDYEGGEFVFYEDTPINLKTGSLLIFPSNFLYPHQVNKVIRGTRYSYVSWCA